MKIVNSANANRDQQELRLIRWWWTVPEEHQIGRIKLWRSLRPTILPWLGNEYSALLQVVWDVLRAASPFYCYKNGGTSGTILVKCWKADTLRRQEPIQIWDEMKTKMNQKYLLITFQDQWLNIWSRLTQETLFAADYIKKFDEFLTRCSELVDDLPWWLSLCLDLAFVRISIKNSLQEVGDLEHAYRIVRDLDASRGSYYQRGSNYKSQGPRINSRQPQLKTNPNNSAPTWDIKGKGPTESKSFYSNPIVL